MEGVAETGVRVVVVLALGRQDAGVLDRPDEVLLDQAQRQGQVLGELLLGAEGDLPLRGRFKVRVDPAERPAVDELDQRADRLGPADVGDVDAFYDADLVGGLQDVAKLDQRLGRIGAWEEDFAAGAANENVPSLAEVVLATNVPQCSSIRAPGTAAPLSSRTVP